MNRAVTLRCVVCAIEVVGVLRDNGELVASNRSRPDPDDEPIAGYCMTHADDVRTAARRYQDAEWSFRLHEDEPVATPEHRARVDQWRAADRKLRQLL